MLTRSLSYYTLSRQQSLAQQQLERATSNIDEVSPPLAHAAPEEKLRGLAAAPLSAMPRSISLQKLNYLATSPLGTSHTHSVAAASPFKHHGHSHSISGFTPRPSPGGPKVELVEEVSSPSDLTAAPALAAAPFRPSSPIHIGLKESRESVTPPSPSDAPFGAAHQSTSPDGYLTTEAGSLPLMRQPLVGNALIHPLGDLSSPDRLPAALVEDFEIVGRAGDESTCDTWLVRSKCSGKLAVFKPRDGEAFFERQAFEQRERERAERLRRAQRMAQHGLGGRKDSAHTAPVADMAEASSSCPHPLSLSTSLRTPLKRGVLYGETTRKEVAAYLLDHEHFAGVPKTLEATIFLARQDAPNGGVNRHDTGVHNFHPYLHCAATGGHQPLALTAGANHGSSPELAAQGRLLLAATSNSPPLSAAVTSEPQFAFDEGEMWLPPPAPSADGSKKADEPERSTRIERREASDGVHNSNLAPPPTLLSPPSHHSSPASRGVVSGAPPSSTSSPSLLGAAGSSPEEFRGLGMAVGLPASASELVATYGSLQEFVENKGSAEDIGSNSFSADEVHRIGILDVRLLNLDRHLGNLLVQRDLQGKPHLVPIDHGFCLPSYSELSDVHLEWTYWKQCLEPFSKETLRYIAKLDPIADAARLRNLGIRDEALVSMVFSSMLLKQAAAAGLTLYSIASMVQRDGDGEAPSTLEVIVARVLGSQQGEASPDPPASNSSAGSSASQAQAFDFDVSGAELPSVEEEAAGAFSPTHAGPDSQPMSRQSSSSQARRTPSSARGFPAGNSPPATPHTHAPPTPGTAPVSVPPFHRHNSDGQFALAEAIAATTTRQLSAPGAMEGDQQQRKPGQRRRSVADAAAHIIDSLAAAGTTPPQSSLPLSRGPSDERPSTQPRAVSPLDVDLPTPPPPNIIRLGTELTLHDSHAAAANGAGAASASSPSGDIPTGAKLQQLLILTETVIREELQSFCARNGITPTPQPSPTDHRDAFPTSAAAASAPPTSVASPAQRTPSPRSSPSSLLNSSLRPPMSPIRSASSDLASVLLPSALPPVGVAASLTVSLSRSRSGSLGEVSRGADTPTAGRRPGGRFATSEAHTPPAISIEG